MSVQVFTAMLGLTMKSVTGNVGDDEMVFTSEYNKTFRFLHYQDCCENVCIEDIAGELSDLVGSPLLQAEEVDNQEDPPLPEGEDCGTWTFYKFATMQGSVTVRWLGTSNGYYSEGVNYEEELAQ